MKATAAVYFLLLTLTAWFSIVHSTCSCSNETSIDIYEFKSCPLPSIFAPQQPSTFPISLPLLTFDELLQHLSSNNNTHPFEDLWEFISFVDGSSVYYLIEEFDGYFDDAPFISDIKDNFPTVSEMKESAAPIVDAVEDKVSPIFSSVKDAVAPVLSGLGKEVSSIGSKDEEVSPIITESYKYGLEYTKNASERVTPTMVSNVVDEAASVLSVVEDKVASVISNVEEKITPYISDSESVGKGVCESFSFSKFAPKLEAKSDDMEDEKDHILVVEFVDDKVVEDESPAVADDTCPTPEEIKRAAYNRMLQSIFKFLSILAFGLVGILTALYFFVLSIVIYVFVKDYFAERFDADANEHFRQLLAQIRQQHQSLRRPKLVLPLPPPSSSATKKDQEQQTEAIDDNEFVGDFFYLVEQAEAEQQQNEDGCSSEADVSMDDTISHSCA